MKRLNWNCGLACVLMLVSACGGKTDDEDNDDTSTADGDGDTDDETGNQTSDDTTEDTNGDGDSNGDGDGGTDAPTSYGDKEEACQDVCATAEACGFPDEECVESCSENKSVSNVGQDALAACFEGFDCSATQTELLDAFLCMTEELEDTPLSAEQRTFCNETSQKVQACTGDEPSTELGDCDAQVGFISDELLAEVNACDQTNCDELQSCVTLQLLQEIDLSAVQAITESGEISARGLSDLMAMYVLSNQLGEILSGNGEGGASGAL